MGINLDEISIKEKQALLSQAIAKASVDLDYSLKCGFGDNKEERLRQLSLISQNAIRIMNSLDQLDYDVRQSTIRNWHNVLNDSLAVFPEYRMDKTVEEIVEPGRGLR